eukprot:7065905-Pyramimonas_sp.AAC.1
MRSRKYARGVREWQCRNHEGVDHSFFPRPAQMSGRNCASGARKQSLRSPEGAPHSCFEMSQELSRAWAQRWEQ